MASDLMSDGTASRTERAAQRLGELARASAPGGRLGTKSELRELCGVSVGTFNEALRVAQARGIVVVRPGPGGGLFAADQSPMVRLGNSVLALDADPAPVADAVRIRDALDPLVIADAAWHSSPADIAGYRDQVAAMTEAQLAGDAIAFIRANWRLHELMTAVNPSPMLRSIYLTLIEIIRDHTLKVLPADDQPLVEAMAERLRIHAGLVEAIAERDTAAIERLTEEHSDKRRS
ncbi:FadR/GntR family transcriptional regulator [Pseudonocardia pini]|uniref:FadR/GntR family transcriptional regulator n=1 Tax=Pseudonocardia pini TaxID=2758030 RepID=UPI0015F0CEA8|nr:FCD domain-containing protein [Pseudonocardia pini]